MKKEMGSKGLSDVVTTVLIILFAIVAVAIIGGIVISQVSKAGQKIDSATVCSDLEITPVKCSGCKCVNACTQAETDAGCTALGTDAKVKLIARRDAGGSSLLVTGLNAVFEKADGTTVTTAFATPIVGAYATQTSALTTNPTDTIANVKKAGLSATITDANGNKITCDYYKSTKVDCLVA